MGGGSPRAMLGVSLRHAAEVIGVSRQTLSMYEADPARVGPERRALIDGLYRDFRRVLERARAARERAALEV